MDHRPLKFPANDRAVDAPPFALRFFFYSRAYSTMHYYGLFIYDESTIFDTRASDFPCLKITEQIKHQLLLLVTANDRVRSRCATVFVFLRIAVVHIGIYIYI